VISSYIIQNVKPPFECEFSPFRFRNPEEYTLLFDVYPKLFFSASVGVDHCHLVREKDEEGRWQQHMMSLKMMLRIIL